jgi:hypothetical protein
MDNRMRAAVALVIILTASSCLAAVEYTGDGTFSSTNETMRWLINRARYSPEQEADSLSMTNTTAGGTPDYDCTEDIDGANDFGTDASAWGPWKASKPPLAPNARLSLAAQKHSQDTMEQESLVHNSPTANYYPLNSEPSFRILDEGYTNNISGYYENLSYGVRASSGPYPAYGRTPEDAHSGLFTDYSASSRGHRQAILNPNAREIGLGHSITNYPKFFDPPGSMFNATFDWYCNDYGRRTGFHFFTGTIFHDDNADFAYTAGEGIGNVEVRLFDGGVEGAYYDVSTSAGSFAIPIADHTDGSTITVKLVNKTGGSTTLSIPMGWGTFGEVTLANNETYVYGTFTQPSDDANVGFRETNPTVAASDMQFSGGNSQLGFATFKGASYTILCRTNLMNGSWSNLTSFTATGAMHVISDGESATIPSRFYRLQLNRD